MTCFNKKNLTITISFILTIDPIFLSQLRKAFCYIKNPFKRDISIAALFLDDNKTNDEGDGKEIGKK